MKYLIQAIYLIVCVGLVFFISVMVPSLFTTQFYIGMLLAATIAFLWFYGSKYIGKHFDK